MLGKNVLKNHNGVQIVILTVKDCKNAMLKILIGNSHNWLRLSSLTLDLMGLFSFTVTHY